MKNKLTIETDNVPSGRYSTPEDIAQAILSLLGPMSDQMTGQNLVMDGGFFRGY
ncbi:SDR family oxidoreductase [Gynuella sp.]|uniref:SDR family oxidoreductase n=1 Tax=Gynuella sp. TaxID=2969146 RepID=UPI003D0C7291